jgi:hypothetical protein
MRRQKDPAKFVALLGFLGVVLAAIITGIFLLVSKRSPDLEQTPTPVPNAIASLEGIVMDRSGKVLGDLSVSVRNGPETEVDTQGKFVLNNVPAGDQVIIVKSSHDVGGEVRQAVRLDAGKRNQTNIIYDSGSSRLGLLSVIAPVDGSTVNVASGPNGGVVTVIGRCDGLAQIFGSFDVWVIVKPKGDAPFFVQHPSAVVDPNANTWRSDITLGDAANQPNDGDHWTLVIVATRPDSGIGHIGSTPNLNLLPQHITSNVVTFTSAIRSPRR